MTDLHTFDEAQRDEIRALRMSGMKWNAIARAFGADPTTVRRAVDEEYRQRRARQIAANKSYDSVGLQPLNKALCAERRTVAYDAMARLAEIPPDTRSLTARICGDPIPGRSALDRRRT